MSLVWRDYANTTLASQGAMLSSVTFDATHPNGYGAGLAADFIASALSNTMRLPPTTVRSYIRKQGTPDTGDVDNCFRNSLFIDDGGTISKYTGAFTGKMPFNYDAARSGAGAAIASTFSLVARTDGGVGNWLSCDITASGAVTDKITINSDQPTLPANIVPGVDYAQLFVDVSATASSGTINEFDINVQFRDVSNTLISTASGNLIALAGEYLLTPSLIGRICTPPVLVPSNTVYTELIINIKTSVGAVVTALIGSPDCRKKS